MPSPRDLYFDAEGTRYYVLPGSAAVPAGALELMNLDGATLRVDPGAIEPFRVDEATADALIAAAAEAAGRQATEAVAERLRPIRDVAPGIEALLTSPPQGDSEDDAARALGELVGMSATEATADRAELLRRLDRLVEALGGAAGVATAMGAKGSSASLEDVLSRLEAIQSKAASRPAEKTIPFEGLRKFLRSVAKVFEAPREDVQAEYRAEAKASVDEAFADFKLPSFKYEDLVKPPEPEDAPQAKEEDPRDG